jgi:predicted CDP-diglyceride synthetase/phosphatidate cytidylyltransferase
MEDDLEKRIADLEGRSAEPADGPETHQGFRHRVRAWWLIVAIAVLTLLGNSRPTLERFFPGLQNPAPSWVGLLFLAMPVVAIAIYFALRLRRRR